jgi:hypothetical protein
MFVTIVFGRDGKKDEEDNMSSHRSGVCDE